MRPYVELFGRVLVSVIFLVTGFSKLTGYAGTTKMLGGMGIPFASVAAAIAMLIELGGGLALVVGWQTRFVAWVMFLYLIVITVKIHNFWAVAARDAPGPIYPLPEECGDHGGDVEVRRGRRRGDLGGCPQAARVGNRA